VASIHVSVYSSNGKLKTVKGGSKSIADSNIFSKGLRKHFSSAIAIEESISKSTYPYHETTIHCMPYLAAI
jgi:hypothetical protein